MKKIVLLLAVLLTAVYAFSQDKGTFRGIVRDKTNNEPLIGANIILKLDRSFGSASDIDGRFSLRLDPGSYIFEISYTGMKSDSVSVRINPGETVEREILLEPFVSQLQGVEVKAGKFDRPIEEMTVSMEIIKAGFIEAKNTQNVQTILDYTPGLNILDNEPQIRGGSGFTFGVGSKVALLVDDMPMLSGDAGRPYWDFVPVENIEQIEVIKGASSVLSGTSALSGAIHIRTALPNDKPLTKLTVFSGLYTTPEDKEQKWWDDVPYLTGANFLHTRKVDNLDVVLGGNAFFDHSYIGAPRTVPPVYDTTENFADNKMATQKVRFNFNLRKRSESYQGLNYGINGNFMYQHAPMVLAWLDDTAGFFRGYPGATILQDQFIGNLDPFINFYSKVGFRHSFKARALYTNNHQSNGQHLESTFIFADYNFRREYDFLQGLEFIGGLSGQYTLSNSDIYKGSGSEINRFLNFSGYTQFENNLFKTLTLSVGLRLEYYKMNEAASSFEPIFRAGFNLKVMKETYVRISYGQGYRYPTIAEKFIRTDVGTFSVFENDTLQPERSWNAEVGVKQGFKFFNYFGYFDFAVFQQEYWNTIEYLFGRWVAPTADISGYGFRFLNTGHSRVTGVDISVTGAVNLFKKVSMKTQMGYNYILPVSLQPDFVYASDIYTTYSYNTTSLDSTQGILKYRFLHTFKGDIAFDIYDFTLGFSAKYFSRIENLDKSIADFEKYTASTGGTLQQIRYMDYFNQYNNGQWILDIRAGYALSDHNEFSLLVNNMLNNIYSLRPLKAEPMRSVQLQYIHKF
ncbi:MAG TPA: TonB-dependent receptor [Bacteroidales bacterium]|nr:TonB-dependent receptor [Bacteroidales bacterium]HOX76890.1 TonB-dependent receptor [Bacteroidales bacterium]HPI86675.1 TonB-dependent receptor [Bacteroidales bacterium]